MALEWTRLSRFLVSLALFPLGVAAPLGGEETEPDGTEDRITELEGRVADLSAELERLSAERDDASWGLPDAEPPEPGISDSESVLPDWVTRFSLGGYGELHANFTQGNGPDIFDIHRLVLYVGYQFTDWIRFNSETEIEHAYVTDGSGGELAIEQAYLDFTIVEEFNVRVGRGLVPVGIINQWHEPTRFNGVERPSFAKYIIPTTWSGDGGGFFGSLTRFVDYEVYVVGGLDGAEFNDIDGIRGGRIKERPSLNNPSVTGRVNIYPLAAADPALNQTLRLGLSTFLGGLDNGNKGADPDIDGDIQLYSVDAQYSIWRFDLRGAFATEFIDGAQEIGNGTASQILGWYVEAGFHCLPDGWKHGLLKEADAVIFARYDDYDTQYRMPAGVPKNPEGDRWEWTFGVSLFLTPQVVLKADYQVRGDASSEGVPNLINLGVGWQM